MPEAGRSVVCVQGLGFVGFAMAVAVADARDPEGRPRFHVIGVDLAESKVEAVNRGAAPVVSKDPDLQAAFERALACGNLVATTDAEAYALADVTLVDVHLDAPDRMDGFRAAVRTLGERMRAGSLVIVETTVPPGTCARVAAPELASALQRRGLAPDAILLAHSYERVMPGREYFRSIVDFWRVYAGHTAAAADACETFLKQVIHTDRYPLKRLGSTTASETAKVLENSYRALNIAFMEEWGRMAEAVGIDMFEVVDAIRVRPTHSNMRHPGFGVGGYCLTKDPLFAKAAARELFGCELPFPLSTEAVAINARMPLRTLERVRSLLGGSLRGKRLLLLGVSYRNDVGDTRFSPSETFVREAEAEDAEVSVHDPLVGLWQELDREVPAALPLAQGFDAVVFAVAHEDYAALNLEGWLGDARPLVFDANNVLTAGQRAALRRLGCPAAAIGRGDECPVH
jgi:nucleotide sugar dehydrogenase